ncbi:MAG TPA: WYL domain-containing protein [Longimicrobiales bacterium]|nr:WYL domain-containing protein [Longimicrobiales bacterium]
MTRPRTTAVEQLQRILHVLPAAAREGGVAVDELAEQLDVTPERVLADLEEATARAYHHAGGATEPFSIFVERRRVHVTAPHDFNRPVRLNRREALALTLGLRALAAESPPGQREAIAALGRRLEAALVAPDALPKEDGTGTPAVAEDSVEYDVAQHALVMGDDTFRGVLADAVRDGVQCRLWYLKPGDSAPGRRVVAPYRLVHAEGMWYVACLDMASEGLRFFRLDRVLDAKLLDEPAPPRPAGFERWLARAPYRAEDELDVEVRYDGSVARWIRERPVDGVAEAHDDGAIRVRHRVADPRWIVRHVLRYGGAAVVEAPAAARAWVAEAAGRVITDG